MATKVSFVSQSGKDPAQTLIDLFDVLPTPQQMIKAADNQIGRIKERTAAGQDVNNQQFAPYSQAYAKERAARGLSTTPNLRVTGRLLDSMRSQIVNDTAFSIEIEDNTARAYGAANQYGGRAPIRRFFDTSQAELLLMLTDLAGEL